MCPYQMSLGLSVVMQDNSQQCGPACIQMVHGEDNVPAQAILYKECHVISRKGWYTDPSAMETILEKYRPHANSEQRHLYHRLSAMQVTRRVLWALSAYRVGVPVLISHGNHWVAVTGCTTSRKPEDVCDEGYDIEYVEYNDPRQRKPASVGGFKWFHSRFSRIDSSLKGPWSGRFVAVPAGKACETWTDAEAPAPADDMAAHRPVGIQSPEAVQARAQETLQAGLSAHQGWAALREHGLTVRPLLVEGPREESERYYIVPVRLDESLAAALAFDAQSMDFMVGALVDEPVVLSRGHALAILRQARESGDLAWEEEDIRPRMVWRLCEQSSSPVMAFWHGAHETGDFYVRLDGDVFRGLTAGRPG